MPIIHSAIKRAKQTIVRRERNVATKRALKDATKAFHAKPSAATLSAAHGAIDTAVKKGVLNQNTAARRKAQVAKIAKEAGVKFTGTTGATKAAPAKATGAAKAAAKTVSKAAPKAAKTATKTTKPAATKKAAAKK